MGQRVLLTTLPTKKGGGANGQTGQPSACAVLLKTAKTPIAIEFAHFAHLAHLADPSFRPRRNKLLQTPTMAPIGGDTDGNKKQQSNVGNEHELPIPR